jgi:phage terminase large subunit-like protein
VQHQSDRHLWALALYGLLGDKVIGAEVYSAAADRDQAALVFNSAAQMVRNSPYLSKRLKILDSQKRIVDYQTGSFYRAISAEAYSKHGFNASLVIYDELQSRKIPSGLIIFADEGHGASKRSNIVLQIGHTIAFFQKQLLAK